MNQEVHELNPLIAIDVVNIIIYFFWLIEFFFITKIIPTLKKWGYFWGYFWGTFSSSNDMTQIDFKN